MPTKLPSHLKPTIVQQWLEGNSRDTIAKEIGLSSGAVTNIVAEWRKGIGQYAADELRELAIALKKANMPPSICAIGFRQLSIMNNLGVKGEDVESFIINIYHRCNEKGLPTDKIASYIEDLLSFSNNINSFSEIPSYLQERREEKANLEQQIQKLKDEIHLVREEKAGYEIQRDKALEDKKITLKELKWYSDLKKELKDHNIPTEEVADFAVLIENIKKFGFDAGKVVNEFQNLDYLVNRQKIYKDIIPQIEYRHQFLKQECAKLENIIASHNHTLSTFSELFSMGFGLKELKLLKNTIIEIADANNISVFDAVQKFLDDVEEQYDDKLGFESKIEKLKEQLEKLKEDYNRLSSSLLLNPLTGPALFNLFQQGVKEEEIILVSRMLKDGNIKDNVQLLVDKIKEYADLEKAIVDLKRKVEISKDKVEMLQNLQNDLYNNVQNEIKSSYNENIAHNYGLTHVEESEDNDF